MTWLCNFPLVSKVRARKPIPIELPFIYFALSLTLVLMFCCHWTHNNQLSFDVNCLPSNIHFFFHRALMTCSQNLCISMRKFITCCSQNMHRPLNKERRLSCRPFHMENPCPWDSGADTLLQHPFQMLTLSHGNARFGLTLARLYIEPPWEILR